jgi:hypothetical protein
MSDSLIEFNTDKEVKEVNDLVRSLDQLMLAVDKLDRKSVNKFSKEISSLERLNTEAARSAKTSVDTLLADYRNALGILDGLKRQGLNTSADVRKQTLQLRSELKKLFDTLITDSKAFIVAQNQVINTATNSALNIGTNSTATAAAARARAEGYTNEFGVWMAAGVKTAEQKAMEALRLGTNSVAAAAVARARAEGRTNEFGVFIPAVKPVASPISPNVSAEASKATGAAGALSNAFKRLTIDGNDVHSMARGLASGFNLLWLTWGNLAPLFAGAAISFGVRKAFDIGSEVEYSIKQMEILGQTTENQGTIIREQLRAIDQTTMFSVKELSAAMVRLGQAGKTPAEALAMLRPAADLASVGMTDLKVATDLLIQTQALFGKSAADSGKMAAQIFSITKSGVLNVEDISGSMKYASEANTRFGKSLEETLTLLGALAQAGLKGSSGGTALINFYRDLYGRSGPAVKALKELEKATKTQIQVFDD